MKNFFVENKNVIAVSVVFFAVVVSFQNCAKLDITDLDASRMAASVPVETNAPSSNTASIEDVNGYVCSAFGTTTVPSDKSGLKTELRFIDQSLGLSYDVKTSMQTREYFNDNDPRIIKKSETLYLNEVNVPTRVFDKGFVGADGKTLTDNNGDRLIEYFGLKMDTLLKLTDSDAEGYYELSTIADDGSLVQIQENGQWITLIDNDGTHPTTMGCMSRKILLTKSSRIPLRIIYHQGPRTQLANVLVWNYRGPAAATATNIASDSAIHQYCGQVSQYDFWSADTSQPGSWFINMQTKGWKIVAAGNFQLPDNEVNPCAYSTYDVAPVVSIASITDLNKAITIETVDKTIMTINLYTLKADGTKELVKTETTPENVKHTFNTGDVVVGQKYQLDVVMEITAKKVKVLKSYKILLTSTN